MPQVETNSAGRRIRRTARVAAYVSVLVTGQTADEQTFSEKTRTIVVNVYGALITLATPVGLQQKLTLKNLTTQQELECRVVHLGEKQGVRTKVGVEFLKPSLSFWGNALPHEELTRVLP